MWQGDESNQFKETNIVYDYNGRVYYITDSGDNDIKYNFERKELD